MTDCSLLLCHTGGMLEQPMLFFLLSFDSRKWFIEFSHIVLDAKRTWPIHVFYFISLRFKKSRWVCSYICKQYICNNHYASDLIRCTFLLQDIKKISRISWKILQRFWLTLHVFLTLPRLSITRYSFKIFSKK